MHGHILAGTLALAVGLSSCSDVAGPRADDGDAGVAQVAAQGTQLRVNGGGSYNAGVIVDFAMNGIVHGGGNVSGSFRHTTASEGFPIEFIGQVTCIGHDPVNNRAWIGGIITANNSTHPGFTGEIHQVGRDIWFRLVDYGNGGSGVADRTTFVGFEGSADIITSLEYCDTKPWPDADARTNALLTGNLIVN